MDWKGWRCSMAVGRPGFDLGIALRDGPGSFPSISSIRQPIAEEMIEIFQQREIQHLSEIVVRLILRQIRRQIHHDLLVSRW